MSFLTDEHVPRVFITTLRASGHDVVEVRAALSEGADDRRVLEYCQHENSTLITHDKQDFSGTLTESLDHPGVVIYTDANFLRDEPATAVRSLERVLEQVPAEERRNQVIWLDEWRI